MTTKLDKLIEEIEIINQNLHLARNLEIKYELSKLFEAIDEWVSDEKYWLNEKYKISWEKLRRCLK